MNLKHQKLEQDQNQSQVQVQVLKEHKKINLKVVQ